MWLLLNYILIYRRQDGFRDGMGVRHGFSLWAFSPFHFLLYFVLLRKVLRPQGIGCSLDPKCLPRHRVKGWPRGGTMRRWWGLGRPWVMRAVPLEGGTFPCLLPFSFLCSLAVKWEVLLHCSPWTWGAAFRGSKATEVLAMSCNLQSCRPNKPSLLVSGLAQVCCYMIEFWKNTRLKVPIILFYFIFVSRFVFCIPTD